MIWSFFKNSVGQECGFHDAGVETFKGNLERYLAREAIQNSLDARDDQKKPVLVKFDLCSVSSKDIPDIKSVATTFRRCAKYWPKDDKAVAFFEQAENLAKAKKVTALRIGDYNTKGVTGSDTDREDSWYSLIRCSGSSSKWAGEGGSFGIGKNAPFAASRMRVVLYSTLTKDKSLAFQGVAKLVSHEQRYSNDPGKVERFVVSRYFVAQNQSRALLRNGIARLWWYAKITHDPDRKNPYELTGVLLDQLDITQQILERNLGRAQRVTTGFLEFLLRHKKELLGSGDAKRGQIRHLAKHLNLCGGTTLLDCLDRTDIIAVLEEEYGRITAKPELVEA